MHDSDVSCVAGNLIMTGRASGTLEGERFFLRPKNTDLFLERFWREFLMSFKFRALVSKTYRPFLIGKKFHF